MFVGSAHITNCIARQTKFHFSYCEFCIISPFFSSFSSFVFLFLVYSLKLDSFSFYWAVFCLCGKCACSSKPKSFTNFRFFFFLPSFPSLHCSPHAGNAIIRKLSVDAGISYLYFCWIYCIRGCCLSANYITSSMACSNFYVVSVRLTASTSFTVSLCVCLRANISIYKMGNSARAQFVKWITFDNIIMWSVFQ